MVRHARWFSRRFAPALVVALSIPAVSAAAEPTADPRDAAVQAAIRERIDALAAGRPMVVEGERLLAVEALAAAYLERDGAPLWVRSGRPRRSARALAGALGMAGRHGLAAGAYHEPAAVALLGRSLEAGSGGPGASPAAGVPAERLADLDLLLSDAFLLLGSHLVSGRVDPRRLTPEWIAVRREVDLVPALERAAEGDPERELTALLPDYPEYPRLLRALARYRALAAAGGWPVVPGGETFDAETPVEPERPAALRRRLRVTGDLAPRELTLEDEPEAAPADDAPWDEALTQAVRAFQVRHGLDPDGRVGERTLAALNVPAGERVAMIEANLERWRWLPQELGRRHLRVNIAGFELEERHGGEVVLEMPVVVGRPFRRTPVFSDEVRFLVLNPYWDVPTKLAVQDKLPLIRKDPGYIDAMGFKVYAGGARVDPAAVDWPSLGAGNFPYRLRQDPGPKNALGKVKFMFPNPFNVYLHDTPERNLFLRAERDLSSGCIRLARPLELAESLLAGVPGWDRERIDQVVASGRETTVTLPEPVPVHLLYLTAWADAAGTVHFRRDVYERDRPLVAALAAPPPQRRDRAATAAPDRSP